MKRLTIIIYVVCVVLVLDALAWVTWHTVNLERREREATRNATHTTALALALWPLDEQANAIIRREASRPYFHFSAFYPAGRPYSEMWRPVGDEDRVVPSPLFTEAAEFVRLHFEVASGTVTSPQVPARDRWEDIARTLWDLIRERESLMYELEPLVSGLSPPPANWGIQQGVVSGMAQTLQQDYDIRAQSAERSRLVETVEPRVEVGAMVPVWVENPSDGSPELLLVRRVSINKEERLQGVWLDWPSLEQSLLASIVELFPLALLQPVTTDAPPDAAMLASIPAMLVPGERQASSSPFLSPARRSLVVTWAAVIAAVGAIGIVLRASMSLSERRGRFVSAVTHELRTPMTTFCLYSQMLADGMVRDESTRHEYLQTLKRESERLAEIVENVLAYARLTQQSPERSLEVLELASVVDAMTPLLKARVEGASMDLVIETDALLGTRVRADRKGLERILVNLVDNACKYASEASDRRVHIEGSCDEQTVRLSVRDHGPGVASSEASRIFAPFHRARGVADSAVRGLGLGLALSRGLALEHGGDLRLVASEGGARFELSLPRVRRVPERVQNV